MEQNTNEAQIKNKQELIDKYISTLQAAVENKNAQNKAENDQIKYALNVGDSLEYISDSEYEDYFKNGTREMIKTKNKTLAKGQFEIIRNNNDFKKFLNDGIHGIRNNVTGIYAKVSDSFAEALMEMSDGVFDAHGFHWALSLNDLKHSFDRHENSSQNENIPMSEKQLESAILRSENGILLNTKMDSGGKRIDLAIKSDDGIIVLGDIYSEIKGLLTFKHAMRFSEEGFRQKYRNKGSDIVIQRLRTLEGDTFNLPDNNSVPKSNISSFETDSNSLHSLGRVNLL